ncbi:MAG: GerMN domain-containing protein [Candidatus Magnetominusculus sp. LBB02]|nr:GerMN domain-containing protein [Candidatus Magnetominusculus sp. LBB02]
MQKSKLIFMVLLPIVVIMVGTTAVYYYIMWKDDSRSGSTSLIALKEREKLLSDAQDVKVFYPDGAALNIMVIKIKQTFDSMKVAETAIGELFNLNAIPNKEAFPSNARVLGIYYGIDKILYVDLSSEIKKNFQGDALKEFLIIKSIYETATSNVELDDVQILINGKEEDTIGGHYSISAPIKRIATQEVKIDEIQKHG